MPLYWIKFAPFLCLSLLMAIDEFAYHRKRGLPKWERIGHPIDTLAFLAPIGFELFVPNGAVASWVYIGMAVLSCLLVAKDEFVHMVECSGGEQLLHAYLFMLHPIALLAAFFLWPPRLDLSQGVSGVFGGDDLQRPFLTSFFLATASFGVYQLVYWNVIWTKRQNRK